MIIALNNKKERIHIEDSLINKKYYCPLCNEELIQKRGFIRQHHYAHKANDMCTAYKYYDMCEWHIKWQERFPKENIEVVKIDDNGKKHIADVIINNIEMEFQHSYMPYEEFNDRNEFYNKFNYHVIWIFDGNDIFNKGYTEGYFPFSKRFECLKKIKTIPSHLDIFIEGNVQSNLFTDSGLFLHHVNKIDEKNGIVFGEKYTIENFVNHINNNDIDFGIKNKNADITETIGDIQKQRLSDIIEQNLDANYIIVYNTQSNYKVLIDKYNIERYKQRKKIYGKLKKKNDYGHFDNNTREIFYIYEPIWIYESKY